jgi:uncharacterized membrane protein YbhN (UPF0104 family)
MSRINRGLLLAVAAGAALYLGFAVWSGWRGVGARLSTFAPSAAALALGLAAVNYLLRFFKWQFLLRQLDLRLPWRRSLGIFLSGFALTVTPGKVGEVLKSFLLRETDGVPMARSAPVVVAERVTDLAACLALTVAGALSLGGGASVRGLVAVGGALVAGLLAAVAIRPLGEAGISVVGRLPLVGRAAPKLREFYAATRAVLAPTPLLVGTALSTAAWFSECVAFFVVLRGFGAADSVGLVLCTFIYAAMTVAGALSFLPGGLLVQEGGMVALLVAAARGRITQISEPTAIAATLVTRLCTLWFAVAVGVVALSAMRRAVDLRGLETARAAERA